MRNILLASAAALAFVASASAADTASVAINATIANNCDITAGGNINLGGTPGPFGAAPVQLTGSSSFTVTCNYVGAVKSNVSSQNGGLLGSQGNTVPYKLTSTLFPGQEVQASSIKTTPLAVNGDTTALVTNVPFSVTWAPAGILSGSYSDTITVNITP